MWRSQSLLSNRAHIQRGTAVQIPRDKYQDEETRFHRGICHPFITLASHSFEQCSSTADHAVSLIYRCLSTCFSHKATVLQLRPPVPVPLDYYTGYIAARLYLNLIAKAHQPALLATIFLVTAKLKPSCRTIRLNTRRHGRPDLPSDLDLRRDDRRTWTQRTKHRGRHHYCY